MAAPPQRGAHTNAFSAATAAGTPQRGLPSDEEDGGSGRRRIRNAGHGKENVDDAVDAEAVARAIARLGRFLDFRERAASEISDKLKSLGYSDAGLRHSVLEKLQQIVRNPLGCRPCCAVPFVCAAHAECVVCPSRRTNEHARLHTGARERLCTRTLEPCHLQAHTLESAASAQVVIDLGFLHICTHTRTRAPTLAE